MYLVLPVYYDGDYCIPFMHTFVNSCVRTIYDMVELQIFKYIYV